MYIGIDVGGTKTLVGVLNEHGEITESLKFPTPSNYPEFLATLQTTLAGFTQQDFRAGAIAIPGHIDRKHDVVRYLDNVPTWGNDLAIHTDVEAITKCPMAIENDAKLGGLSQAVLLKDTYSKVMYITVSTGIGVALIVDCHLDPNIGDSGGHALEVQYGDKHVTWESIASGRAIVERYGLRAEDIIDPDTWRAICRELAKGLIELIAIAEPEVIVIGGSVGTYFERYGDILKQELQAYHVPLITLPELRGAERSEQAVVYGCYELARQQFPA